MTISLIIICWVVLGIASVFYVIYHEMGSGRVKVSERLYSITWGELVSLIVWGSIAGCLIWLVVLFVALHDAKFWNKPVFTKRTSKEPLSRG